MRWKPQGPGRRARPIPWPDILAVAALAVLWIAMALAVNPAGDFPLDDDWSYAKAVKGLLETGRVRLTEWTFMSLVGQVYWGALFCLPYGFSYTALRVSSLAAGLLGVAATYGSLRVVKASAGRAFLGGMVVAACPLYFSLSNTFMTDVPFFAIGMWSFFFFLRGEKTGRPQDIVLASLLACGSCLVRQLGVLIPLSAALASLLSRGLGRRGAWRAFLPVIPSIAVLAGYQVWLKQTGQAAHYNSPGMEIVWLGATDPARLLGGFVKHLALSSIYLGAFMAPFLIQAAPRLWAALSGRRRRVVRSASAVFGAVLIGAAALQPGFRIPELGNILFDVGVGPVLLHGCGFDGYAPYWPTAPPGFWLLVSALGAAGAALLGVGALSVVLAFFHHGGDLERVQDRRLGGLAILLFLLYLGPVALQPLLFDRHLLFCLPPLMVVVTLAAGEGKGAEERPGGRLASCGAALLAALWGFFAVAATHDHLAWNRARWEALDWLEEEKGASAREIDGGFEYNAARLFNPNYVPKPGKSPWWVEDDRYAICLGPMEGRRVLKTLPFGRWAPPGEGKVLVLESVGAPADRPAAP